MRAPTASRNPLGSAANPASMPREARTGADTRIGAGLRLAGDLAFGGVLRVQGEVTGDIVCPADPEGTVVVDAGGRVIGRVEAPHVVVMGCVAGSIRSSASVRVRRGASVSGDVFYRDIDIQAGAVIEGALVAAASAGGALAADARTAPAARPDASRLFSAPRLGLGALVVAAVFAAVAVAVWISREPAAPALPPAPVVAAMPAVQEAPPASAPAPPVPSAGAPGPQTAERPAASAPREVVTIQGVNPAKPVATFLLVTREAAVLFRKPRQESGEGSRIEVPAGRTMSVEFGKDDLFRVAEGRKIEIFYQGRKVAPRIIERGAWMSFVPQPPPGVEAGGPAADAE